MELSLMAGTGMSVKLSSGGSLTDVQAPKVWDGALLEPYLHLPNLFWWYNMYSSVDYGHSPRCIPRWQENPDIYAQPGKLRSAFKPKLGQFPLFNFWGPQHQFVAASGLQRQQSGLNNTTARLCRWSFAHLDCAYSGLVDQNQVARDLQEIDAVCGDLIDENQGCSSSHPLRIWYHIGKTVHLNRMLRSNGLLNVREELGELLDAGASTAFAVADHQVAHVC